MPEGPEVAITAQYLKTKLKKKTVASVEVLSGKYTRLPLKGLELTKNTPLTFTDFDSKGKFLWFEMIDNNNKKIYLLNTLGLTGRWSFHNGNNSRLKFVVNSSDKTKQYTLYYIDDRNFGTLEFT